MRWNTDVTKLKLSVPVTIQTFNGQYWSGCLSKEHNKEIIFVDMSGTKFIPTKDIARFIKLEE